MLCLHVSASPKMRVPPSPRTTFSNGWDWTSTKKSWIYSKNTTNGYGKRPSPRPSFPLKLPRKKNPLNNPFPPGVLNSLDVFFEKTHEALPPHQPYDHIINLKPDFIPKIAKIYFLNPAEKLACKVFVDKHLKIGCIVPSNPPKHLHSFLSPRKMDLFIPAKTTIT